MSLMEHNPDGKDPVLNDPETDDALLRDEAEFVEATDVLEGEERPGAVLRALNSLEELVAQHNEWLKNWHLEILSGLSPHHTQRNTSGYTVPVLTEDAILRSHPRYATVRSALVNIRQKADQIFDVARKTGAIPPKDYDQFMNMVLDFASSVRQIQNDTWNQLVNVDSLTGLGNRRAMWRKLRVECERQARNKYPCCVAMLDLDLFKEINDTLGHATGDIVLRNVASSLRASIRPYDAVFRFGGDEFLVCLPNADLRAAWAIIERLRLKIARSRIVVRDDTKVATTLSVGIAPLERDTGVETALERADAALYAAKRNGRNCVHAWRRDRRDASC